MLLADLTGEDRVYAEDKVSDEPNAMIIYTSGTTSLPKGKTTRCGAQSLLAQCHGVGNFRAPVQGVAYAWSQRGVAWLRRHLELGRGGEGRGVWLVA